MGWFGVKKDKDGNEIQPSPREKAKKQLRNAIGATYAVAALNTVIGAIILISQVELPEEFSHLGVTTLIEGLIFGGLALWIQKKRSVFALGLALGLYLFGTLFAFIIGIQAGRPPTSGIGLRIAIIYFMGQGFDAIKQLKSAKADGESAAINSSNLDS
ncbi:MAG: hypothetical protein AAF889_13870 [Cyanobacteria bacterium P01_D01_bin.73]